MRTARLLVAAILTVLGLGALAAFDRLVGVFLFASPDGVIAPETLMELRLILVALLPVGAVLFLGPRLTKWCSPINLRLESLPARPFVLGTLALGLLIRLSVAAFMPLNLYSDFGDYDQLAHTWASDGCYCENGHPTGYWPPGYPFFLSRLYLVFGHAPIAGALANVLLSLLIAFLSYRLAREAFAESAARWTLLLLVLLPSQALFVNLLASEMLFTPLLLASLILTLRAGAATDRAWAFGLAGGLALGLATLTRSLTQLFWVLPPAVWYVQTRNAARTARYSAVFIIAMAVAVGPWMWRNHELFGRAAVSLNGGVNLWIGNHAGAGAGWNDDAHAVFSITEPWRHGAMDRAAYARAWEYIASDPVAFAKRGIVKAAYFLASDMTGVWYDLTEAAREGRVDWAIGIAAASQTAYTLLLLGALLGGVSFVRRTPRTPGDYLLVGTVAYWVAVHFVVFGHGRFHFPIVPVFCVFAGLWLSSRKDPSPPM